MMSEKMATIGFLNVKVFSKKGYGVIIFGHGHDVTNKILTRDSNNIVNVVM